MKGYWYTNRIIKVIENTLNYNYRYKNENVLIQLNE